MSSLNKISVFLGAITLIAFSLPVARRAHAQIEIGVGKDVGVVESIDDGILKIRSGSHTRHYKETDNTKWLDQNGRRIDPGDVVGKTVEVRFQLSSEAMSVQIWHPRSKSVAPQKLPDQVGSARRSTTA
jgi:hypothetical protein